MKQSREAELIKKAAAHLNSEDNAALTPAERTELSELLKIAAV